MSQNDRLQVGITGIEQIIVTLKEEIAKVQNAENQLVDVSTIINNFVLQTLQHITDNNDLASANEVLVNSLIQIKDFASARPQAYRNTQRSLLDKISAYEQCKIILLEVPKAEELQPLSELEESEKTLKTVSDETKTRIMEGIDESGNYTTRRKIAQRPEKIRDVRTVEAELAASSISPEDN